jgi:hypothetical protein
MCIVCSRRTLIVGSISTLLAQQIGSAAAVDFSQVPCGYNQQDLDKVRALMRSMPGGADDRFHRPLVAELRSILSLFGVTPGFQYIEAMNAFALKDSLIPNFKGTVLIGVPLVRKLLQPQIGGVAVAGVLAHECAHIHQYFNVNPTSLTWPNTALRELHADLLAGYYLAKQKGLRSENVSGFQRELINVGTENTNSPNDHGAGWQRAACMNKGFSMAGKTLEEASREGVEWVRRFLS